MVTYGWGASERLPLWGGSRGYKMTHVIVMICDGSGERYYDNVHALAVMWYEE